jgi:hypothetical protein
MLINKELKIFVYNDKTSNINLFNLSNKVNIVYSINNSGTGFISYNPNSSFNSLNSLETNKTYLIAAKSEALPTIIQAATTSTTQQPGVPTTPFPDSCYAGFPAVQLCIKDGFDPEYNSPSIAKTVYDGQLVDDDCYCQCDTNKILNKCKALGYNSQDIDFIQTQGKYGTDIILLGPCSSDNCKCANGWEYSESKQRCVEKNPKGACCLNGSCNDDVYLENCYGGFFAEYTKCKSIESNPGGFFIPSSEAFKKCFACSKQIGFTGYTCPSTNQCVYCNTGDFFDPASCECYENCSDIIQNLPKCEAGDRNPDTCECCPPSIEFYEAGNVFINSFGYSECIDRCAYCEGFDVEWNESECKCKCVSNIGCKGVYVKNAENCNCDCPAGTKESCESRGYEYVEDECRCQCSTPQGKLAQQKCPGSGIKVPGQPDRDRWNPFTCECDCSDRNCAAPKVVNPLNCFCQCPQAIEQGIWEGQIVCPNSNEEFNRDTCECEPKRYGAWCTGQFCPPKGQQGSVFITTGCSEGTFWSWVDQNQRREAQNFEEGKVCKEISCEIESLPPQCTTTTTTTTTPAPTTTTTTTPVPTTTTTTVAPTTTIGPTTTVGPTTTGGPSENKWYCIDC